jgi:transposase-like protein
MLTAAPLAPRIPRYGSATLRALRRRFVAEYRRPCPKAVETLERDWERMLSFFAFPQEH